MNPPAAQQPYVFEYCLGAMRAKVPQLREAMTRRDEAAVRGLARDLRNTVGLLGLPRLFQMSQDIEYRREDIDPSAWDRHCHRFCDLLERIHYSLQSQLERN